MLRFLLTAGLLALALLGADAYQTSTNGSLFPEIVDTSHTCAETASFFHQYFTAKSLHDPDAWLSFFDPIQVYYYDAAVGGGAADRSSWVNQTHYYTSLWGKGGLSYPVRLLGDLVHGAVIHYTDTAQLFGDELRIFSAVDFRNKKITRQIDYWDGRGTNFIKIRVPDTQYPKTLGVETVTENASRTMESIARELQGYFSSNNFTAAAGMFSYDGVFEDLTLQARQESRTAIGKYLQNILPLVPYGRDATVRHVLGTDKAGGYEWYANKNLDVLNGISALELDDNNFITRMSTVWESSKVSNETMERLVSKVVMT